jgi:transcriptional regulator with XRE-family HTH domain
MSVLDRLTGRQIAAGRVLAGLSQAELASAANISVPTLGRMEASTGPASGYANNVGAVRRVLESAGVEFTNGEQPGVRIRAYKLKDADQRAFPIDLEFIGFGATDGKHNITIRVERSALEYLDDQRIGSGGDHMRAFDKHRSRILRIAAEKYEQGRIGLGDVVSVRHVDVAKGPA